MQGCCAHPLYHLDSRQGFFSSMITLSTVGRCYHSHGAKHMKNPSLQTLRVGWEQTKSNPVSPGFIGLSCTCSPIHKIPQCLLIPWTVSLKYIVTKEHVTIIMNKPAILTHTWPSLSVPLWFCLVNVLCSLSCTATHTYPKMTSETVDRL